VDGELRRLIDEVKARTDLVALIGRDIELAEVGSVYKGRSPVHRDSDPSFVVWKESRRWCDFSGGGRVSGDCLDYVMWRRGVSFMEALRELAAEAGLSLSDGLGGEQALRDVLGRRRIEELLTEAAAYYHGVLPDKVRRELFREHYGFSDDVIDRLQLGWADGHLFDHFKESLDVSDAEAISTGLFVRVGSGIKDLFAERLVFPYWRGGRAVYLIARRTDFTADAPWEQAKYKKLLTHSSKHAYVSPLVGNDWFYNEDAARGADELLITEGVTDCISAMQVGVACISPVTVRFRKRDHEKLIELTKKVTRVVICNDAEESCAGEAGALETAGVLIKAGRSVRIASLPREEEATKLDVNELVRNRGAEALREVLAAAKSLPEHLLLRLPADAPKADLDRLLAPVVDAMVGLPPIERDGLASAVVERFGVGKRLINRKLKEAERRQRRIELSAEAGGELPTIDLGNKQAREVIGEAQQAIVGSNPTRIAAVLARDSSPSLPPLFIRGGRMVALTAAHDQPRLVDVDEATAYGVLARIADWVRSSEDGIFAATPPHDVARDLLAFPPPELPTVEAIASTALFGAKGMLLQRPGLHAGDRLWLQPDIHLGALDVPEQPDATDVTVARAFLADELLCDFPFVDDGDRAHAIAALLLPFARRLIDGPTPLHVVEAPSAGSGKGLFSNLVSLIATGRPCDGRTLPVGEEETRKMITAELGLGRPLILLDNASERRTIDSPPLASVLTASHWTDRVLGESRMITLPNRAMWILTANNPRLSMELARRCVRIRIDPKRDMPWTRGGFRHDPIGDWVMQQRPALVRSALVLIQAWVAAGRLRSDARLGSFESWAAVMGGILEVAGVPGFLSNLSSFYEDADEEGSMWREFTQVWWEKFVDKQVRVAELNELCGDRNLMEPVRLRDGKDGDSLRAQQTRLGKALRQARDRVYGDMRIALVSDRKNKGKAYALRPVDVGTGNVIRLQGDIDPFEEAEGNVGNVEGTCAGDVPRPQAASITGEVDPWGT